MNEMSSEWMTVDSAPMDGRIIRLKGHWPREADLVEIEGFYETGGFTEGWADAHRHNVFYATHWLPAPQS